MRPGLNCLAVPASRPEGARPDRLAGMSEDRSTLRLLRHTGVHRDCYVERGEPGAEPGRELRAAADAATG